MMLLRAFRVLSSEGSAKRAARARTRQVLRRGRPAVAGAMAPVLAGGLSLLPVTVAAATAAGVAALSVAHAAPAKAATTGPVLVLLQNGESTAPETTVLQNAGYTVTQATPSQWAAMTKAQLQGYAALVIGDPSGSSCSATVPGSLGSTWQSAVSGNVAVLGTAPALAGTSGANALIKDAAGYAAAGYSSSGPSGTGLYLSLNCDYSTAPAGTAVSLLNGVENIQTAGGVTVQGGLSCSDTGTANTWEAESSGTFGAFTSSSLGSGSWPSPACPVQEAFDSWPAMFTPLAYDAAPDASDNFTASDGAKGQPYVLLGAPVSAGTQALAPSTGGEVPAGSTAGGTSNPAAPGVSQASAGDPVDTENGDFTQSSTDVSLPGFGPALDFSRTYDAQAAQQETVNGTPGAMGYGWTDNWASSLTQASPVSGDIYTLTGTRTDTGQGGPPQSAALNNPGSIFVNGADTYFVDTNGNRVEEIPGTTKTQWGQSMTAGDIYTVVGSDTGAAGDSPNGTAAHQTGLYQPAGLQMDSAGDLFIADTGNDRVIMIPASAGKYYGITMTANDSYTIAGVPGHAGVGGDQVAATSSDLNQPMGLAIGPGSANDVYIADSGNNRIQEVSATAQNEWNQNMTAGDVYTVAGSSAGTAGTSGMNGVATSAKLDHPEDVAIKTTGLYIADTDNDQIAEVALSSGAQWGVSSMTVNDIYTIAGRDGQPAVGGDGKAATSSDLDLPSAITVANGPNIYIADTGNNRIQEVAGSGHTEWNQSMTQFFVYTIAGASSGGTSGDSGDGGPALSALLDAPAGLSLDVSHDLLISDTLNNEIREVNVSTANIAEWAGGVGTFATDGDNGPAALSGLNNPRQEAFDAQGDIYIADAGNNRIQEIAAYTHQQFNFPPTMKAGNVYTIAGRANGQAGCQCDGSPAYQAFLDHPQGVVMDAQGNLYIADTGNNRIQEVPATGGLQWNQNMTIGDMYTVTGDQHGAVGSSGDGGLAGSALLDQPAGLAVDADGDIYIADAGNNRIQEVAATSGMQWGQSMTAGHIYTVAGSPGGTSGDSPSGTLAGSSLLNDPTGISVNAAGNLFITDTGNNRVVELPAQNGAWYGQQMTGGDIYTIAGGGAGGDGGPATSASLNGPGSIAVAPAGDVYFADTANNRIQEIPAASGTQWSQSMTADDIYTVAGSATGAAGNSGDGGPATSALISTAESISLDSAGDLYITDNTNNTIREVPAENASYIPGTSPQLASAMVIAQTGEVPAGVTITQPGDAQITFYPAASSTCAPGSAYVTTGSYCTLPQNTGATLSYNSGNQTYTFSPSPGTTYTYASPSSGSSWPLTSESDADGNNLTITYSSPAPGSGQCPSSANSCETITAASGRTLVIGMDAAQLVTSVTDPLGREWKYGYSAGDLVTVTDPMGNATTYTYGAGNTSNPELSNDLLTITSPNAQPGGPDAGDATVNVYDALGRVTSQTDPMGFKTTFDYTGMDPTTGNGIITITDPDGNRTVDDYTAGDLAAESRWTGATLTSEQDYGPDTTVGGTVGGSLLDTWSADGNRNITTVSYDAAGTMVSASAPDGETSSGGGEQLSTVTQSSTSLKLPDCGSDATASATCQQDPAPATVVPGSVISPPSQTPVAGVSWTLYDNDGNDLYTTTGVYDPGSNTAAYTQTTYQLFNGNSVTLPGTNTAIRCTVTSPSMSLPCASINAAGVVTQFGYDPQGDLISSSTPDGNGSELATTTYTYDADGEQTGTTSPDGNLSGANAGNYTTVTAYNADGQQTSTTQAGGTGATVTARTSSYHYDGDGNQTSSTDARGYATTTAYNPDDQAVLITDPDGNATLTCYDGDGNTAQTVPPAGVAANNLTPASCPVSYPAGYGSRLAADATADTFDALGQKTQETTPLPAGQSGSPDFETSTYAYDSDGDLVQATYPPATTGGQNQIVTSTYTSAGELGSQTVGSGSAASTISYCYDPTGDMTSVVYADGNVNGTAPCDSNPTSYPWIVDPKAYPVQGAAQTTYGYDGTGELLSITRPATTAAPNGATTTYTYDAMGDELTSTNPDGVTTTKTYTPAGLAAGVSYSGSSAHPVTYTYDANGNMTAMSDASSSSTYGYDPFGELTSATNGSSQVTQYGYDSDGDNSSITYPLPSTATWATSDTVSYSYDHAGLLTGITDFTGSQIAIGNTADGLPSSVTLGPSGDTIATSYDPTDSPTAITLKNGSSTLQSFSYSYSPGGSVLNEADTPSSSQSPAVYSYDNRGRVTSMTPGTASTLNYSFDASSDLTTLPTGASGNYDNAGELTTSTLGGTTTSYTYDAAGQRLAAKQGSTTLASGSWNGASQLTTYSDAAGDMTTASYDGTGHRVSSSITPAGGSATAQNYLWNGDNLLMDSVNAYIYGGGTAPLEQVNLATGAATYLNTDSLGSVRGTVNASGALTGTTSYDAWGNPQTSGGLTAKTPFGYAGGYTDPTGLVYLINRYYDPATGQFTSLDPDVDQTLQPYAYTAGDPVSQTDPTGLFASGGCANAVPSCRYKWALELTYHMIQRIMASQTLADILAFNLEGEFLAAAALWLSKVRTGQPWDEKTELRAGHINTHHPAERGEQPFYTRVTQSKQIFYNVWGNVLYGYVGMRADFSARNLQNGAEAAGWPKTNTAGNYIERQMGIDMYQLVGSHYTPYAITRAIIWHGLGKLSRYCDVRSFPGGAVYGNKNCSLKGSW